VLIVFGGLPGTGKTTLARLLAAELSAAYVRIDALEAAMGRAGLPRDERVGLAAYTVAHAVAEGSLLAGATVVVDAVNPVEEARRAWRELAHRVARPLRVIEVTCSDQAEHRRRVEQRTADLDHDLPTWSDVLAREYEPWKEERLVVDTCEPQAESLARIKTYLLSS
jgi:predicted kinase